MFTYFCTVDCSIIKRHTVLKDNKQASIYKIVLSFVQEFSNKHSTKQLLYPGLPKMFDKVAAIIEF